MDLNNLILILILIGVNILFYKHFLVILNKYNPSLLIDDQLKKPQAFHTSPTSVIGGMGIFFSLLIIYFYFLLFKNVSFFEHLSFCTLFFLLGFIDDLKINVNPKIRLTLMIVFNFISKI